MGKYLKSFQTSEEFYAEKDNLIEPWVVFIHDVDEADETLKDVRFKHVQYTVNECIEMGYFSSPTTVDETDVITTLKKYPYHLSTITDFNEVFIGKQGLDGATASRPFSLCLGNKEHLTEAQQRWYANQLSSTPFTRGFYSFKMRGFYLPNTDVYILQNAYISDYQYSHDIFSGSTFRNVTLGVQGNISSAWHMFRGLKCESLEFVCNGKSDGSSLIRPYNNTGEMYVNATIKYMPRNINYSVRETNWLFTGLNVTGEEMPSIAGVNTEEERLTNPNNTLLVGPNMCYQLCMGMGVKKFGPVFDCIRCNGYEYLWGNCALSLPNATNVRVKNINNIDYDFRGGSNNHKNVNIPKMDLDSIKYVVENMKSQCEWLYTNHKCDTPLDKPYTVTSNSNYLIYHHPTNRLNNSDGGSATMFTGKKFKVQVPVGFKLLINGYRKSGSNYYATGEVLTVNGDVNEQNIDFTNANSTYAVFMITNLDGTEIYPSDLLDYTLIIKRVTSTDGNGVDVYTAYDIPSHKHKCTFPSGVYTPEEVKNYLGDDLIQEAQAKGWDIYVGATNIRPTDE
jgi:hypothetical protein